MAPPSLPHWTLKRLCAQYGYIFSVQLLIKFVTRFLKARRMHRMLKNTPKSRVHFHPILGDLPETLKNLHRLHDFRMEQIQGLPVSWVHAMPFDPNVVSLHVLDPACVRHFLKDNFENYSKAPSHRDAFMGYLRRWLGDGIFTARHGHDCADKGRNWYRQRKIASLIFKRANFNNNMQEVFVAKGKRFCDVLATAATKGAPVDMQLHFFSCTMDSIMQIFFGVQSDTLGGDTNMYAAAYDTAHRSIVDLLFARAALLGVAEFLPWPFGGFGGICARLCEVSCRHWWSFRRALTTIDGESRRLVATCRQDPNLLERRDLLALFVQAESGAEAGPSSVVNKSPSNGGSSTALSGTSLPGDLERPERMSTEWLRDVVLNFVIAGRDTTACALSWMFFILATHPEIQETLRREIDEQLPRGTSPSFKAVDAKQMPYLNGVVYETLRLYPPVPVDSKEALSDDVLPDGTPVPRHSKLAFFPYVMGRDPQRYPDPERVNPERWMPFLAPQPHEFPVFQAGPRICLGQDMAMFEIKIFASMLLREFSFEMAPGEAEKITYLSTALTMSICNSPRGDSHNLWLIPRPRHRDAA